MKLEESYEPWAGWIDEIQNCEGNHIEHCAIINVENAAIYGRSKGFLFDHTEVWGVIDLYRKGKACIKSKIKVGRKEYPIYDADESHIYAAIGLENKPHDGVAFYCAKSLAIIVTYTRAMAGIVARIQLERCVNILKQQGC